MSFEDKRFYVYLHKRLDNDEVFYVGKGTGNRLNAKYYRNKDWFAVESISGFKAEIIAKNLTESEALALETRIIESGIYPNLTNKIIKCEKNTLDKEDLNFYFEYDENSPSCLSRKVKKSNNIGLVGKLGPVGHKILKNNKEYFKVKYNNKSYLVHRIIWAMFNGEIQDGFVIDHIDGNGLNNKIENLRCVTKSENSRNIKKKRKTACSKNLPVGVHVEEDGSRVRAVFGGKSVSFSINKYGEEQALRLATEWRKQQEEIHNFNLSKPKE